MNGSTQFKQATWPQMLMAAAMSIAVNIYISYTGYINYYLTGVVGFSVVVAGSFVTVFRIWDAVTDVGMGMVVDRTNTRLGKFRPFMIAGGIGSFVSSHALIYLPPMISEGMLRKAAFILIYLLFVLMTTMQACALRASAQVLTNDPKQRATMGMLNGIALTLLYSGMPILVFSHIMPMTRSFNLEFFTTLLRYTSIISLVCIIMAILSFGRHDVKRSDNEAQPASSFNIKEALSVLVNNKQLLMLVLSARTDKLATTLQGNATIVVIIFAIVAGNSQLSSAANAYTMWPSVIMILLGVGALGRRFGAKRSLVVSSWGGLAVCVLSILLWIFGNPHSLAFPDYEGFHGWTFFTIAYLVLWCAMKGFGMVASNSLNPMLADVIDYEEYRGGKYLPGIIGALFNLADKIISSLGSTVIALLCAMIGFTSELPTVDTPYSVPLFAIGLLGMYGLSVIGLIINLICLRFYHLTPEKMAEIRGTLAERKALGADRSSC